MNPRDKVVTRFEDAVRSSLANHDELVLALFGKKRQASLETVLVEQLVLSTAITWEAFLSDLFVAYIEMKPKTCLDGLARRLDESVAAKFGKPVARLTTFERPSTLGQSKIAALVDPAGWNLSLSSASKLSSRANEMLASEYARRFSLEADQGGFIDFSVALRNYLGHRSTKARRDLRDAHARLSGGKNAPFVSAITKVGSYLRCQNADGESRATLHALRLVELAKTL